MSMKRRNVANEDRLAWSLAQQFVDKHRREITELPASTIKFRASLAELIADVRANKFHPQSPALAESPVTLDEFYKKLDEIPNYVVELEVLYAHGEGPRVLESLEEARIREQSEAHGRKHAPAFIDAHRGIINRLIGTYIDKTATEALALIREAFWSGDWAPPAAGKKTA